MNEHNRCVTPVWSVGPRGTVPVGFVESCRFCGVMSVLRRTRLIQTISALDAAPSAESPKSLKLAVISCKWTSGFEVGSPRLALFGFLQNILKDPHDMVEGIPPF